MKLNFFFVSFLLTFYFYSYNIFAQETKKPFVVTSFSILKSLTQEIAGKSIKVISIVGPNEDPHTFIPTPYVSEIISKADLIIINGLGFEGWIDRLIQASGYSGPITIATKNILPLQNKLGSIDPHAWGNPENIKYYLIQITKSLSKILPSHKYLFEDKFKKLIKKIDLLLNDIEKEIKTIPRNKRKIITTHDAFEYFGKRFHINFFSPLGNSTDYEPSAKEIAQLINFIKQENIKTIFIENITNEKLIYQLAEEIGIKIDGPLYSDALSTKHAQAKNYFDMIKHNFHLILRALK